MKIELIQSQVEEKNRFEIRYDGILKYKAKLPFISINEPFELEKIRQIKITNLKDEDVYTTEYNYIENLGEEFIPFKYLATGSQKFNQLSFLSKDNNFKIYLEQRDIFDTRYVIDNGEKKYFVYSVEDGYIRHLPIYDGDIQIGEALKSNVIIDEKDEYLCYLKDGYENLADGVSALLLYLDRTEYSSSYLVVKSCKLEKKYSYSKNNKFYNKEWVKNSFGDEFYKKVDKDVEFTKQKLKNTKQTFKEQWNSLSPKDKKLMKFIILAPWVAIAIGAIITLIVLLINFLV